MTKWPGFLSTFLLAANVVFADTHKNQETVQSTIEKPQGWSVNVGGGYTWMSFSTPPTYSGSTGAILGKLTYQQPKAFFGEARSVYNLGRLSSSLNKTNLREWYSEFVGGYCFTPFENWTVTPYAGLGLDFLSDHHTAYSFVSSIHLNYSIYYAIAGLATNYTWKHWMLGWQIDCLPTFNQYLKVKGLSGSAWTLKNRVGAAVRLPVAYRCTKDIWLELTPYYRFFPVGASKTLGLHSRNLNQYGAFLTFRFFL